MMSDKLGRDGVPWPRKFRQSRQIERLEASEKAMWDLVGGTVVQTSIYWGRHIEARVVSVHTTAAFVPDSEL